MKICHCIKMTDEEKKALHATQQMLWDLDNDEILSRDFNAGSSVPLDDIIAWFNDVVEYFERW